ncbi:hypothetical protein LTR37_001147 [Vermiconidia calcicola]|uniref:Uncharacterized protein n=1 Tax=Vermiconidia calcicola TaxID=1690605 RepID=A0ACC3NX16_9PEZI|nr:hypothetical protein LTR37_001147 [Vermiconidia calcicola]
MADYFSEYSAFIGAKGLPSPADTPYQTPYETPGFIRSKRSSRTTAGSSREPSSSPPPLPPDTWDIQDKQRDGRYTALDPRRFTPTLHASLVSEILNLRRELDSKNNLVENLETSLSFAKSENDTLSGQVSEHVKEVRKAKLHLQQMEKATYDAVEDLISQRDSARDNADDLRNRLEAAQKTARRQDEDAERTQDIWESEKERWDNERRQMERRLHVTEGRLRTVVDEMTANQAAAEAEQLISEDAEDTTFKDSGLGNESDTASVRSATPVKHRRNMSSLSYRSRSIRYSTASRAAGTPEPGAKPNGYNLADELGIDEEDEYDIDEFEHPDEELEFSERLRRTMESRQSSVAGDADSKAKRILGLTTENIESPTAPTFNHRAKQSIESATLSEAANRSFDQPTVLPPVSEHETIPRVEYVDNGYQPSPPSSPPRGQQPLDENSIPKMWTQEPVPQTAIPEPQSPTQQALPTGASATAPPISPPDTPTTDEVTWPDDKHLASSHSPYTTASTQTDFVEPERAKSRFSLRDSLSPPSYVPSIAIHPPASRPSTPKPYVLPPGTKNASTQANIFSRSCDAAVQTEGIRVDKRPVKLPQHLLPSYLLPSPKFPESPHPPQPLQPPQPPQPPKPSLPKQPKGTAIVGTAKIFTKPQPPSHPPPPPPRQPQQESRAEIPRNDSQKDLRSMPLRAIPLPRPVLSPHSEQVPAGPLNRSAQYGVTKSSQQSSQLLDMDKGSDVSDSEDFVSDFDTTDLESSIYAFNRPPHGRFGLSEPPKAVPEDKEISPERRPGTGDSYGAAPAPSVASSRANSRTGSHRELSKPPAKLNAYKDTRSRSPSFGSMASSSYSVQSGAAPPFPIPTRSSSRVKPNSHSEGSQSPSPYPPDVFGNRGKGHRSQHMRQASLRKVQSAAVIRHSGRRGSPQKPRMRHRRSPNLTPIQSMAFESPAMPTNFSFTDIPSGMNDNATFDYVKGSVDLPTTVATTPRVSEEGDLVDAIAGTMVGEWMWKYIRKRKSFGVQEDCPVSEDGSVNTASHGTRHRRWVWLSPYERTIMWDNKQPASGNALLGKKGRKLAIQSVLDVQDTTPLPKNPELKSAFKRSILVLTPERALKFTTISAERHALWMNALSFLAQSGRLPNEIPPMPSLPRPPPAPQDPTIIKRYRSPSFGKATVRDSIRIAKGKRPELPKVALQPVSGRLEAMMALENHTRNDSADFPAVPRLYISTSRHQRKRSNTSPRLPPAFSGFRSFSSTAVPSSASSALHPGLTTGSTHRRALPSASSKSGSGGDSMASPDRPNFFEAVGTVRMEAFVDPNVRDGVLYVPAPPSSPQKGRSDSYIGQKTADKRRVGYVFDENGFDPFKNF